MKRIILVLIFCGVIIAGFQYQSILRAHARFFTVDNAAPGADAILVLAGNNLTRVPKALELYQAGYAPRLLLTTVKPIKQKLAHLLQDYREQADLIANHLSIDARFELMPSAKDGATSTFDEAYDLLAFARQQEFRRVIIVTDGFHTRRALLAFSKVFADTPIVVEASAAPNDIFNEDNWWRTDLGIGMYVVEPVKYLVYLFTDRNVEAIENN